MNVSKSLQIIILSTITLGLQSSGHTQSNLVNLYDWKNTGINSLSGPPFITNIWTSTSPDEAFGGLFFYNNVSANLDTTPGASYEISFSGQFGGYSYWGGPTMSFGSFSTGCELLPGGQLNNGDGYYPPVNFDFTVVATDPITAMSFTLYVDNNSEITLSNVSVIQVPEISPTSLIAFGGCILILARQWRRTFQKRKRS